MITYLSAEDILEIHAFIISETGGAHGLRDREGLLALFALPQQSIGGKELYQTIYEKAGVYIRNIIATHPFVDGNKRTAITSAGVFLKDNGFILTLEKGELEKRALWVVSQKPEIQEIAKWLEKNSKKWQ